MRTRSLASKFSEYGRAFETLFTPQKHRREPGHTGQMWSGTRSSLQHRRASLPCRGRPRRVSHRTPRETRETRERRARHALWYGAKPGPYRRGGVHVAGLERVSSSGGDGHGDAAWIRIVTRRRSRTGPHARRGEHLSTCMCGRHEAHRSPPGIRPRRRAYAPGVTLALGEEPHASAHHGAPSRVRAARPSLARGRRVGTIGRAPLARLLARLEARQQGLDGLGERMIDT